MNISQDIHAPGRVTGATRSDPRAHRISIAIAGGTLDITAPFVRTVEVTRVDSGSRRWELMWSESGSVLSATAPIWSETIEAIGLLQGLERVRRVLQLADAGDLAMARKYCERLPVHWRGLIPLVNAAHEVSGRA